MRTTEMVLFAHFLKTSKFIPACISIYILSLPSSLLHLKVGLPPSFPWYLNPLIRSQHNDNYHDVDRQVCLASWALSDFDPLSLGLANQIHSSLGNICLIN